MAGLARQCGVTQRTIWRDVAALQEAGFPLVDEKPDGRTRWKLLPNGLKGLQNSGLDDPRAGIPLLQPRAGAVSGRHAVPGGCPQRDGQGRRSATASACAPFSIRLPGVLNVKATPLKKREESRYRKHIASLLTAVLEHRQVKMQYYSASSKQTKEYLVEPYRLAYAQGGMYLLAHVPKYRQIRTFAVERIKSLSVRAETFDAPEGTPAEPFAHSLGVNTGPPEKIEIEFLPEAAVHVRERSWHPSQQVREKTDGSIRLTLNVCNDWALRSWILSFGPLARVVSPSALAEAILEQLEDARDGYAPHLDFGFSDALLDYSKHPKLPL